MPSPRLLSGFVLPLGLLLAGCGYVHVGRLPDAPVAALGGDAKLASENADLRLEKKILQQELAITRAQGEALRLTIENRAADGDVSRRLAGQLTETTRELAELRAGYARLQADRAPAPDPDDPRELKTRLAETEEKLAATLRNFTELQNEVGQLKQSVLRARAENLTLSMQARTAAAQHEQTQAALAKLNVELLAEKDARTRAEQQGQILRTELRQLDPNSSALAQQRTGTATGAQAFTLETKASKTDPAPAVTAASEPKPLVIRSVESAPTSRPGITVGTDGVNATLVTSARPGPRATTVAAASARTHQVSGGDTLAKISAQYYGTPARWNDILIANREVMGDGNTLVIGRILRIP